jgi:hypothetical protein
MQEAHPDPDPDGEEAREGTAAHWTALDTMLLAGTVPAVGTLAPNGYPVDRAMLEGGEMLVDDVRAVMAANPGGVLHVERRVAAHRSIHPNNDGTPDAYLIDMANKLLFLWDYKYGHKYVPVRRNWQTVDYVACIAETHGLGIGDLLRWTVVITIVQPRSYNSDGPVREWHPTGRELVDMCNDLRTAAYAALALDAPTRTGDHCYKCTAAWDCEAHLRSGQAAVETVGTQVPLNMSPAALALWLHQVEVAEARLKSVKDAVTERTLGLLRRGLVVPGRAIGSTSPLERWRDPAAAAQMGDLFGVELRKPEPALVTPKQARKLGIDAAVITEYAETPTGAQKLIKTDSDAALAVFGPR